MLMLKILGGWNDAVMAAPVFLERRLRLSGFDTHVYDRMFDFREGVAQEDLENHIPPISIPSNY